MPLFNPPLEFRPGGKGTAPDPFFACGFSSLFAGKQAAELGKEFPSLDTAIALVFPGFPARLGSLRGNSRSNGVQEDACKSRDKGVM